MTIEYVKLEIKRVDSFSPGDTYILHANSYHHLVNAVEEMNERCRDLKAQVEYYRKKVESNNE